MLTFRSTWVESSSQRATLRRKQSQSCVALLSPNRLLLMMRMWIEMQQEYLLGDKFRGKEANSKNTSKNYTKVTPTVNPQLVNHQINWIISSNSKMLLKLTKYSDLFGLYGIMQSSFFSKESKQNSIVQRRGSFKVFNSLSIKLPWF